MMCWENLKDSPGEEPHEESENIGKKSVEKTQKPKDEEEHVESIFEYEPKHASSTDARC